MVGISPMEKTASQSMSHIQLVYDVGIAAHCNENIFRVKSEYMDGSFMVCF